MKLTKSYLEGLIRDTIGPDRADQRTRDNANQSQFGPQWVLAERSGKNLLDDNPFLTRDGKHMSRLERQYMELEDKPLKEMNSDERSKMAARAIGFLYRAHGNPMFAAELAAAKGLHLTAKALAATILADGGAMLPVEYSSAVIDELFPASVILGANPGQVDMPTGTYVAPYIDSGSTAYWVGENQNITPSQQTTAQLMLSAKKLATVVPTSNDLLRRGGSNADTTIRNNIVRNMRKQLDSTLIRGLGTAYAPKGLRGWVIAANTFAANATVNLVNVSNDLSSMIFRLENGDVPTNGARFAMNSRSKEYLRSVRTGSTDGVKGFPEVDRNELMGHPLDVTSQIPINLGGGTNESEVYLWQPAQYLLGVSLALVIEAFPGAAYYDGSAVVSGVSLDQTPIRSLWEIDFADEQRGASVSQATAVKWGV
jgi:HK97 family phage major capsid protein